MTSVTEARSNSRTAELRDVVAKAMESTNVPGVAVGILNGDEEVTESFGVTSLDNPLDVTPDTLFQIGSTTKTVTGLVAMQLVEQGRLSLDEPVRTHLRELRLADPEVTARLTLRHLLTHTGGFDGDYFCDFGRGEDALARAIESMTKLTQVAPLGEVWSYCNSGFYIAGRLIEVVTGKPYEVAAREMALDPIGLKQSFFFPEEVMTYRFAVGHATMEDAHVVRPWQLPRVAHPAGGLISSIRDNLKYARFMMGEGSTEDGTRLVSRATLDLMQSQMVRSSGNGWIGLTWHSDVVGGLRVIRHGGGTNGQVSAFLFVPERKFALAVLTNASRGELLEAVTAWAFKEFLGIAEPTPTPTRVEASEPELAALVGHYDDIATTTEIALENGSLRLTLKAKPEALAGIIDEPLPEIPAMGVAMTCPDAIVVTDGPYKDMQGDVIRRDGSVRWLRMGGRLRTRVRR